MVLKKSRQVLPAILAEQKAVDSRTKLLESKVGRREDSATSVVGGVVDGFVQASLDKSKLKRAELSRKEADDFGGLWWWEEDAVDPVDDSVGSELCFVRYVDCTNSPSLYSQY